MNIKTFNKILLVFAIASIMIAACTKEGSDVRLDPALATTQYSNVKSDSATIVGFVVAAGSGFSEKGVCYGTSHLPTIDSAKVIFTDQVNQATFTVKVGGLKYATKYYARAYAITPNGAIYGSELTFTTAPVLPTVTTSVFTPTTGVSATGGGEVTNTGGADITERGVCYDTKTGPTYALATKTKDGAGAGVFVSSLTKLSGQTKYYVRAYAKNVVGIAYGPEVTFTTPIAILTWNIPGDYVAASYPGSAFADWSPDKSPQVISTLAAGNLLEGYVYMAKPTNNWKFASQPNWNGPNYANNDANGTIEPGKLDPNAKDNIASPMGYYKINADATALTYTALATTWAIIGNATPGGWGSDTPMTYDPANQVWKGGATLSKQTPPNDGMKFRANGNWNLNYGDTGADGKLDAGGDNIGVSVAGDYAITLDLSHPNAYTYSLNRWGIIGGFNGWAASLPMTWDAVNQVLTVTVDLPVGGWKFRANDNWNLNLGGKGSGDEAADNYSNATTVPLAAGGKNISAGQNNVAGNYTITLDPWSLKCTVTKN
jgi:hypothetical protein